VVAELLRLKLRLLANAFRSPRGAVWAAVGVVLGGFGIVLLWGGATLAAELDAVTRVRVVIVIGVLVSLGAFFVPAFVSRTHILPPRALRLFGLSPLSIGTAILLLTLVGPALLLVPIAISPLLLWTGPESQLAAIAVPLIVLEGMLAARVGAVIGAVLPYRPVAAAVIRLVFVVLLVAGLLVVAAHLAPTLGALLPVAWWPVTLGVVAALAPLRAPEITEWITVFPVGAFWRAPAHEFAGRADLVEQDLLLGGFAIVALGALWITSLRYMLRPTRRVARARAAHVPGWFRRLPSTPIGAVSARSFTYWARDPRYRAALVVLPIVPIVTLLATYIAGIPFSISVLVPLPLVVLLLAWGTLHNDLAYDSTALWMHLVAQTRGVHDRLGRLLPVLAMGLPVVLLGTALTAWLFGDWLVAPAVLGVSSAILLGGIGVSSLVSARSPYPATRPGDAPFQQPQVPGASGGGIQAGSILLILLVSAPAVAALVFFVMGVPGPWTWIALASGLGAGLLVLALGIRVGGAVFDRRAPELLEFAARN
jgi:ABC-2 type transport system permease protein